MEEGAEILCDLRDGGFLGVQQHKLEGVFLCITPVVVEIASIGQLKGKSYVIILAHSAQNGDIFLGFKLLRACVRIVQTDIDAVLRRLVVHNDTISALRFNLTVVVYHQNNRLNVPWGNSVNKNAVIYTVHTTLGVRNMPLTTLLLLLIK